MLRSSYNMVESINVMLWRKTCIMCQPTLYVSQSRKSLDELYATLERLVIAMLSR